MAYDIIKINTDIELTNSDGIPIEVKTQEPEYMIETFSWDGVNRNNLFKTGED